MQPSSRHQHPDATPSPGPWLAFVLWLALATVAGGTEPTPADEAGRYVLLAAAQVDGRGVFLPQVLATPPAKSLAAVRLAEAPAWGQVLVLTRAQIEGALAQNGSHLLARHWSGPNAVRITRRGRPFTEAELKTLLQQALQRQLVQDRGELELALARPWPALQVPADSLRLKLLDLPFSGLSSLFTVRFELVTDYESVGAWPVVLQARVWREIWVARSALKRGELLSEADMARERRNLLLLREPTLAQGALDAEHELTESLPAGSPVWVRSVRAKPAIRSGQNAEACLQEGALSITLKVEVLEDGAPGQVIRLRNPQSRRELRGKVQHDQTIQISL